MSEVLKDVQKAEAEAAQIVEMAQAKAEGIKREAERSAREVEDFVRAELLEEIKVLREEAEKKAKAKAKQIAAKAEQDRVVIEELGQKNMRKAVDFIIKSIFELGGVEK